MLPRHLVTSTLFFALVGVGCSSSSSSVSPFGDPTVYARGICNFFARCHPAFVRAQFGSVEICASFYAGPAADRLNAAGASITKRQLDACIIRSESATCDDEIESLPECDFKGTHPIGGVCATGVQCATGSCFFGTGGAATACGTCSARVENSGDCSNASCGPGLECVNNQCAPFGGPGAPCGAATGATCRTNLACAANGVCVVPRKREEPCDPTGVDPAAICDAAQGLSCSGASLSCAAKLAKEGEPCPEGFCDSTVCLGGICRAYLQEGAECTQSGSCVFPTDCVDGRCQRSASCN